MNHVPQTGNNTRSANRYQFVTWVLEHRLRPPLKFNKVPFGTASRIAVRRDRPLSKLCEAKTFQELRHGAWLPRKDMYA